MRILLLAGEGRSTRILFHRLEQLFGDVQVIVEGDVPRWTFLSRRVKSLGLMTVVGQVLFKLLIIPVLQYITHVRQREILMDGNMDDGPIPESRILRVVSANDKQTVEVVKVAHPDLIVINGTRILSNRLLTSAKVPWINMHAGITPLYRGVHGGYWALVRHEPEVCGVTVHLVDPGIDTGGILKQGIIHPTSRDAFTTYPLLQLAVGLPLLCEAIKEIEAGTSQILANPPGLSALWSHPTIWGYLWKWMKERVV